MSTVRVSRPPPCRAEHVGSLLRPPPLLSAFLQHAQGSLPTLALESEINRSIEQIVRFQQRLGCKCITDGEFGRYMFYDGFFDGLEGMVRVEPDRGLFQDWLPHYARYKRGEGDWTPVKTYQAQSKVGASTHQYVKWFESIKQYIPPDEVRFIKMTTISPEWYHFIMGSNAYTSSAYANDEEYLADVARAYRRELAALYEAGCRNVQIDAPLLAAFCDPSTRSALQASGIDPDQRLEEYIGLFNECLKGRQEELKGMTVGVHLCRGNSQGKGFYEGGYGAIARRLFERLDVDCFYLEFDTPRAGTLEPLRHFPKNKVAVLGLISSKTPQLEDKDHIISLLKEAGRLMGDEKLERVCLSPQCGFASRVEGNPVTDEDMEAKLRLVADIAKEVWGTMV